MTGPADLLSAYLDDELDPAERAAVERYLEASPEARADLAGLNEIRSALRALPELDPPGPLVPARPGSATVSSLWSARRAVPVLLAAALVFLAGFAVFGPRGGDGADVAMPTAELMELHRDAELMVSDGSPSVPGDLVVLSDTSGVDHMPDDLGAGMDRMGVYGTDELVQLIYSDGEHVVSVFEQPHDSAAPMVGDEMAVGGRTAMHQTVGGAEVLMVADGDMVLTIMSEGELDSLTTMAGSVLSA